jgi:hypothetical protein
MSPRPTTPTFDEWFAGYQRKSPAPMQRANAMKLWNALLDAALEEIVIARDQFVLDREYESAGIARDAEQLIRGMTAPDGRPD